MYTTQAMANRSGERLATNAIRLAPRGSGVRLTLHAHQAVSTSRLGSKMTNTEEVRIESSKIIAIRTQRSRPGSE